MTTLAQLGTVSFYAIGEPYTRQIVATLNTGDQQISGRGKGNYPDNLASALFELLEHAVCQRATSSQASLRIIMASDLYLGGTLPVDAVGKYLQKTCHEGIPAVEFQLISDQSSPSRPVWLPAALFDSPSHKNSLIDGIEPDNTLRRLAIGYWSTNGYAAGMNRHEALLHAVNEIVERDAFSAFLLDLGFGHPSGDRLILNDSWLSALMQDIERTTDSTIELRVLPALTNTVVIAIGSRIDSFGRRHIGCGASFSPQYAIERALMEYEQAWAGMHEHSAGTANPSIGSADERDLINQYPFLQKCERCVDIPPPISAIELHQLLKAQGAQPAAVAMQLENTLIALHNSGHPVIARTVYSEDRSTVDGNTPAVVQAVVLGAEQFHLVTSGIVVEPIARLRDQHTVQACRQKASCGAQTHPMTPIP